jgi:hypothetical protein
MHPPTWRAPPPGKLARPCPRHTDTTGAPVHEATGIAPQNRKVRLRGVRGGLCWRLWIAGHPRLTCVILALLKWRIVRRVDRDVLTPPCEEVEPLARMGGHRQPVVLSSHQSE